MLRDAICKAAEKYESFYLYDERSIKEQTSVLRKCFPSVEFLYSVKCNSDRKVAATVFGQGFGADAASAGEVELAAACGLPKEKIFYSAPGKSRQDIRKTLSKANLIADSISEIERIRAIAKEQNISVEIGIRLNPEFTFDNDTGIASKFGIDEADALQYLSQMTADDSVRISGIHVHVKSQELSAEKLNHYYRNVFQLADKVEKALHYQLRYINLGSGIGIPYASDDPAVDIKWLGKQMETRIESYRQTHSHTRILIEVGRYAVGKSGVYVMHVVDRKISHGKVYIVLQNTLNGFIRPSIARLLEKYTDGKSAAGTEPLFTGFDAFTFEAITDSSEREKVTLVGNLCTAADVIAENIELPKLEEGDLVVITNAGSYAAVLSPMQFSTQEKPVQLMLTVDGEII